MQTDYEQHEKGAALTHTKEIDRKPSQFTTKHTDQHSYKTTSVQNSSNAISSFITTHNTTQYNRAQHNNKTCIAA